MSRDLCMSFQNATGRMRALRLEPWARDFIMRQDEKVELTFRAEPGGLNFRVVEAGDTLLIYTEGCDQVWVIQGGITQELLPAYAAAITPAPATPRGGLAMWDRDIDGPP